MRKPYPNPNPLLEIRLDLETNKWEVGLPGGTCQFNWNDELVQVQKNQYGKVLREIGQRWLDGLSRKMTKQWREKGWIAAYDNAPSNSN